MRLLGLPGAAVLPADTGGRFLCRRQLRQRRRYKRKPLPYALYVHGLSRQKRRKYRRTVPETWYSNVSVSPSLSYRLMACPGMGPARRVCVP